jgi:UDP-sulfoquinovose synthase
MRDICPEAHLLKLGTMGEYGTPDVPIPEGFFNCRYRGREDRLMFPRDPGSFYHLTKVHDTHNIRFACKVWGLRSTDIMQGVVYGTRIDAMAGNALASTRFDFDQHFGTAINRFVAQSIIGLPLTPFGEGGQTRGFLPLRDSMQCFTLAIENPPEPSEYRTFNQFEETYSINELAHRVERIGNEYGLKVEVRPIENPRKEAEHHFYNPEHQHLLDLGYKPTHDMDGELRNMFEDLVPHKERIEEKKEAQFPNIRWDGQHRKSRYLSARN